MAERVVELQVVASTLRPGQLSLRVPNRADAECDLRAALVAAGFRVGEQVVLVAREAWERRGDATAAIGR